MQQVTLVLRGNTEDITAVIELALAGGLLQSMTQDKQSYVNAAQARRNRVSRSWTVGQTVRVVTSDSKYPNLPVPGTQGVVTIVHKQGMASAVTVDFGKPHGTGRVPGRMLKGVK